jgi:hypothetical protein
MQFTRNGQNAKRGIPNGIWRIMFFCMVFLSSLVVKAQPAPVGAEFSGKWSFDRAEAQERPMNSQQNYVTRSVSESEFNVDPQLLDMPTGINFTGYMAQISHPSWTKQVLSVINNNVLEFYDPQGEKPEPSGIESYAFIAPSYSNLKLNGNSMSMQCSYIYSNAQGKNMEVILTIYYKR